MRLAENVLHIQNATMLYAGQVLAANGSVEFNTPQPHLDFNVKGESCDLAVLSDVSSVMGELSFQAVITGRPAKLEISGDFAILTGSISSTPFANVAGLFSYANSTLVWSSVSLNSMGGKLRLSGSWDQQTGIFEQEITGQGLEAEHLSGKAAILYWICAFRPTGSRPHQSIGKYPSADRCPFKL